MNVLGINGIDGLFHDASASLAIDGVIVAAVAEERFTRIKHAGGIPWNAITWCLQKGHVAFSELDAMGYYLQPDRLAQTFVDDIVTHWGGDAIRLRYYLDAAEAIRHVPERLVERFGPTRASFHFLNHHLCHAESAYHPGLPGVTAILTIDGAGDRETAMLHVGRDGRLRPVRSMLDYPESLGYVYSVFAHHLGFDWISGPGKLMGLAGYGDPRRVCLDDVIRIDERSEKAVSVDLSFFDYHLGGNGFSLQGSERFGRRRMPDEPIEAIHQDLAASVQRRLEDAMVALARSAKSLVPGADRLSLAGGVALNIRAHRRIVDAALFDQVTVAPAASDDGTSIGAALHLSRSLDPGRPLTSPFANPRLYLGPDIERDYDLLGALDVLRDQIDVERLGDEELARRGAALLAQHAIIGWARGPMECGPRALGHRSILANPTDPMVKSTLNRRVKGREEFRPYAPSILAEHAADWFDLRSANGATMESPFMLLEAAVQPDRASRVPGIVHVDGTSRPQTVRESDEPVYHRLLTEFHALTGVPMVLNTSFNRHGEPIVNTPEQAIEVLLATELDALFLGSYVVTRRAVEAR